MMVFPDSGKPLEPTGVSLGDKEVRITWNDGHGSVYPHRFLRESCPCAGCRGEPGIFGRIYIPPQLKIREDVKAERFGQVGRYALSIAFSDGHRSGIYSYQYLRSICRCDACRKK